ncbi:MAG: biotin/lipoyl-binding protein [Planctomycetes bacterium]|nr:biotin/lipoyl-binding protein [Planctomycetota bacterium]
MLRRLWLARGLELSALGWTLGVLILSARLTSGWWRLRRMYRLQSEELPERIAEIAHRLGQRLGIGRAVHIVAARAWEEPVAFGLLRPIVLMPMAVLTQCPIELVEAMIAHELAHIRRHDLWMNMVQRVIETLLFYHPAVWWVSGRMRLERELCCDDLAILATGRRADYATALVELCRVNPRFVTPAMAAGIFGPKLSLLTRVRRVLQSSPVSAEPNRSRFWLTGPLSLMLAGAFVVVASLRTTEPGDTAMAAAPATQPAAGPQPVVADVSVPMVPAATRTPTDKPSGLMPAGVSTANLANGVQLELASVALHPSKGGPFWKPDGSPLTALAYDETDASLSYLFGKIPREDMYEFAIRMSNLPVGPVYTLWDTSFSNAAGTGSPLKNGKPLDDWRAIAVWTHDKPEMATVRFGVAAGEWKTLKEMAPRGEDPDQINPSMLPVALDPRSPPVFQAAYKIAGPDQPIYLWILERETGTPAGTGGLQRRTTHVSIFTWSMPWDAAPQREEARAFWQRAAYRVVAVDRKGVTREAANADGYRRGVAGGDRSMGFSFELALDDIDHFSCLSCPYRWGEFRNVCLPRARLVPVRAATDGIVAALKAKAGQSVEKGDLLVQLDDEEIRIELRGAEARQRAAQNAVNILQEKWQRGRSGQDDVRRAETELAAAETDMQRLSLRLQRSQIKSPATGIVRAPNDELATLVGKRVSGGDTLFFVESAERAPSTEVGASVTPPAAAAVTRPPSTYDVSPADQLGAVAARFLRRQQEAESRRIAVRPLADGVVLEVKVKDGQAVKKGDLLVQLDDVEIKLDFDAAKVRLQPLREAHDQAQKLHKSNAISASEVEKAATEAHLAEIELQRLMIRLDRTRIASPADGTVRAVEGKLSDLIGQRVAAGDLLLYIEPAVDASRAGTQAASD